MLHEILLFLFSWGWEERPSRGCTI